MKRADYVELNGSYGDGLPNRRLADLVEVMGLQAKLVANSDAHARGQMGSAYTLTHELHATVADTLRTRYDAQICAPRRAWGTVAKFTRIGLAPVGMGLNLVQRVATRRALARLPA